MLLSVCLKILSELSFLLSIAGCLAAACQASESVLFTGLFFSALCFALSFRLSGRGRGLRLLPFALILLPAFSPGTGAADRIVLLLCGAFSLYQASRENFLPDHGTASERFSLAWKLLPAAALLLLLIGKTELLTGTLLPMGALSLILQIFLLRLLRHDPAVRNSRSFQLLHAAVLTLLLLLLGLLSSRAALAAAAGLFLAIYRYAVTPLLMLAVTFLGVLLTGAGRILSLLPFSLPVSEQEITFDTVSLPDFTEEELAAAGSSPLTDNIFHILGIVLVFCLLVFLFVFLSRKRAQKTAPSFREETEFLPEKTRHPFRPFAPKTPAMKVRNEYRRFLKLCRHRGIPLADGDTSADIERKSLREFDPTDESGLRQLYLRARYLGESDPSDARHAAELVSRMKRKGIS